MYQEDSIVFIRQEVKEFVCHLGAKKKFLICFSRIKFDYIVFWGAQGINGDYWRDRTAWQWQKLCVRDHEQWL